MVTPYVDPQEAYEAGFDAYLADLDNPYTKDSPEWDAWERGWSDGWWDWNGPW